MSSHLRPSNEPPAKRQKLQPEIQRSPNFWFKKGDFVLVASQKVAYRIHADVLGRKSKVFNDLLDLDGVPRPDSEDTMDGCPIVHVTDSPEDFNVFLSLIYDSFEYHQLYAQEPRWATARIMIVLGDKYDATVIREEGLKQLRGWYAEDIDEWDKRDKKFFAHYNDHLSVANITHTLGDHKLHALVLYECCRLSGQHLVLGDPKTGCPPLCADDLVRVIDIRESLPRDYLDMLSEILSSGVTSGPSACTECRQFHRQIKTAVYKYANKDIVPNSQGILDISIWPELSNVIEEYLCDTCASGYELEIRNSRRFWRGYFFECHSSV